MGDGKVHRLFIQGGLAAMAGAGASHPLDVIKVRLQIQGEGGSSVGKRMGPWSMGIHIVRTDGPGGLFRGLTASLLRQAVYSSVRFGVYDSMKTALGERKGVDLPLWKKVSFESESERVGWVFY